MTSKLALLRNRIVALQHQLDANTLRQYQQSANLAMTPFKLLLALLVVSALGFPASSLPLAGAATTARYVAPTGSDSNPGTLEQPWRTITKALRSLQPGYTLYVRGGTYAERVTGFTLPAGTSSSRITVQAYPGERPIVKGLLWLKGANYWTFDGINVTWDSTTGQYNEHMLKFTDGTGWVYTNAEIWGARSFAAILIAGAPASYTLSYLNVHDTYTTNAKWQDHLIYINSYAGGTGGVIERSLLWNSPNGRAIKIGPSSASTTPMGNVTIRYNTMYNNLGPTNVNLSYGASNNRIEHNIMQKVSERQANVDVTSLNGTNNVALNNLGWESTGVVVSGVSGLSDGGGNLFIDPQLRAPASGDFYPENVKAEVYGRYASLAAPAVTIMTPTSIPSATPSSAPASTSTPIATSTPIRTASPTSTPTTPPTNTPMPTSTSTPIATNTPTAPSTSTPLPTSTATPMATSTPAATSTAQPSTGSTFSFTPVADTYTNQASPDSAYGSSTSFSVVGGSTSAKQAFLRFDVTGLPAGASVSSAKLRLFVTNDSTSGGVVHRVTNTSWAESITWNTKPAIDGAQLASLGAVTLNQVVEVVLPVETMTGNGSYSFAITLPSSNTNALAYASRQASTVADRPQLIITTSSSTSAPTATSTPIPTASPTSTAIPAASPTSTPLPTSTSTPMATRTPTTPSTSTPVATATHTSTPIPVASPTSTAIPAASPTSTPLPTSTATPMATSTPAATSTTQPSAGSAFSFTSVADTYVDQASSGSAYGSSSTFSAVGGSTSAKQAFLRFDVTGLPAGASVSSVKLRLFVTNDSTSGGIFQRVTNNAWAETITWSTKPAIDGAQLASVGAVTLNEVVEVVLPAGTIAGNGSYSFAITLPSSNTNALAYASRQNATIANRPQLLITTQ